MGLQETMRALSDPTRREILQLLKDWKLSAGEIAEHFEISNAAISRHLSVLKDADLVRDCRDGKFIIYEINTSVLQDVYSWVHEFWESKFEEHSIKPFPSHSGKEGSPL